MSRPFYDLIAEDGGARAGLLRVESGEVETPVFMPVGTQGTVKALSANELERAGIVMLLANAFHLSMRPGEETVASLGGLHEFMGWKGPLLTDSGGFQVWSMRDLRVVEDEGVRFRSPVDGSERFFSPEIVIEIERKLAPDIMMPLDVCAPYPSARGELSEAMERTHRWLERSVRAAENGSPVLFGIVQGGTDQELRRESARRARSLDLAGYAVGGVSVGEGPLLMREVAGYTARELPREKPRYLMGVGPPDDLLDCIASGYDMFDCVMPTRNGRGACAFTAKGKVRLRNSRHARSRLPIEEGCDCPACARYSRGYLRHLFLAGEQTGGALVSLHNLCFYDRLMKRARRSLSSLRTGTRATAPQCLPSRGARRRKVTRRIRSLLSPSRTQAGISHSCTKIG